MPVRSTVDYLKEKARQSFNEDSNFLSRMLYFFELRIPSEVGVLGDTDFIFPLVIPPESYTMDEPFTVEATPTQGGGLVVEENGIVQRMIRLRGHTGFKPRNLNLPSSFGPVPATLPAEKKSYSRELPVVALGALSGHRHFQYLNDSVFRTYADLKRDPIYAKNTFLIFHNPRDDEHWLVVPQRFSLDRDAASPFLYRYNIELLVVDKAEAVLADFSEDKSLLDQFKDAIRTIKKGISMVSGAINDLNALVGEIKNFISDIASVIDTVTNVVNAASDFVDGVTEFIESPFAAIESAIDSLEEAAAQFSSYMEQEDNATDIPEMVKQKIMTAQDGLELIATAPARWETPTETSMRELRGQQEARRGLSSDRKEEALALDAPSTFDEVRNLGTQLTPGDVTSSEGEITAGSTIKKFKSARQVTIEEGDTLTGLAARYMGDARAWQYIAIANGLKPPFLDRQASAPLASGVGSGSTTSGEATGADESPFVNSLGVGRKILIPSNKKASTELPILPVLGVKTDEPVEHQFLGTDLQLEAVTNVFGSSKALYDVPIDIEHGSVDVKKIAGMDNMSQVIILRLLTEKGTDTLYKNLGIRRILGLGFTTVDIETARYRVSEAINGDARVAAIQSLKFEQTIDQLVTDVVVIVRGFSESRKINVAL